MAYMLEVNCYDNINEAPTFEDIEVGFNIYSVTVFCSNTAKQLFKFTKYTDKIYTESVYGGEKIDRQIARLKRATHIIVATPGRLIDLLDKPSNFPKQPCNR